MAMIGFVVLIIVSDTRAIVVSPSGAKVVTNVTSDPEDVLAIGSSTMEPIVETYDPELITVVSVAITLMVVSMDEPYITN